MISSINGASLTQSLALLELSRHDAEKEASEQNIDTHSDLLEAHKQDAERAAEKAREEAEKGEFWSDVKSAAAVAAAVGGVVAAAGTGGSSLVITMAVIGAAGTAATQTDTGKSFLKDQGMSDEAIMWTGIASAGLSMGAGAASAGSQGMGALEAAGTATSGASGVVGGVAYAGEKRAESRGTDARADGVAADHGTETEGDEIDDEIDRLKRSTERHTSNFNRVIDMQNKTNETLSLIVRRG